MQNVKDIPILVQPFFSDLDLNKKSFANNPNKGKKEIFTVEEIQIIKQYVENSPTVHNISAILLAKTGMRDGECVALKWEDINFRDKTIHVHRTETTYKDRKTKKYVSEVVDTTKTENGNRNIVVDDETIDFLKLLSQMGHSDYETTEKYYIFDNTEL